ncbi:MAG TPA: hypothetical protein DCG75_08340 [Bacteroidales bacterium]|nr:hypothetical protein [Bacteroidales bacterium]
MIVNFPKPYDDEIFYSVVARYFEYYRVGGHKKILKALFLSDTISATLDFPSGLKDFCCNIKNGGFSEEYIINNHTLFPYYSRFIDSKKKTRILDSMNNKSGNIHTRVGINAGVFSPLQLPRFCRKCYNEDIKSLGESYFRRAHQIPSVPICLKHNVFLEKLYIGVNFLNKHYFIPPSVIENYPKLEASINDNKLVKEISQRACNLLKLETAHIFNNQAYLYNRKIKELGFLKNQKSIDLASLYEAFENHFSPQVLLTFKSQVDINDPSCWLKSIVRKHRKSFDPIRHILIENFVLSFNNKSVTTKVKSKKWPCLNPVCEHYNKKVISKYKSSIDKKTNREIKYIECSCGYGYTESYLENKGVTFRRVKIYGNLWEEKLNLCISKGISIRKTAQILNCDSKTIKLFLDKKCSNSKISITMIEKKKQWLNLIKQNSKMSITELRKLNPALYSFIYHRDSNWLTKQKYPINKPQPKLRIDWGKRDSDFLLQIKESINYLKITGYNKRKNKTLLISLIGKQAIIEKNYSKLPLTASFLEKVTESKEDYRIRRLKSAQMKLIKNNIDVNRWRLLREARIREDYLTSKIEKVVEDLLNGKELKDKNLLSA